MEASARIFNSSHRLFSNSIILKWDPLKFSHKSLLPLPISLPMLSISPHNRNYTCNCRHYPFPHSSIPPPHSNPLFLSRSLNASQSTSKPLISNNRFARNVSGPKDNFFEWKFALDGVNGGDIGIVGDKSPVVTVVLLGWLGSQQKHLRRYAELYNSRGIHSVSFVASVNDVLSSDLGKKLEERVNALVDELALWFSETKKDGRERFLIFHTFSNTGWLAYGAILVHLQGRQEMLDRIKGCVVDSGGDPDINPKVWAAGFTAALLKKHSSATYSSVEAGVGNELENGASVTKLGEKEPLFIEVFLLAVFEKLFSYILNLPNVNERLRKIISTLSRDQPPYPQLFLYSTADKVIPVQSVESFIADQRKMGRKVTSFNFGSSPHVDHYRTFPDLYSSMLHSFLNECTSMVKQM